MGGLTRGCAEPGTVLPPGLPAVPVRGGSWGTTSCASSSSSGAGRPCAAPASATPPASKGTSSWPSPTAWWRSWRSGRDPGFPCLRFADERLVKSEYDIKRCQSWLSRGPCTACHTATDCILPDLPPAIKASSGNSLTRNYSSGRTALRLRSHYSRHVNLLVPNIRRGTACRAHACISRLKIPPNFLKCLKIWSPPLRWVLGRKIPNRTPRDLSNLLRRKKAGDPGEWAPP